MKYRITKDEKGFRALVGKQSRFGTEFTDTLKKMSLQISIAVFVILILKKKLLMLARSIM